MEKEYFGFIEGYVATTDIDSQGDCLTPEVIEKFAEVLRNDEEKRVTYYQHDTKQPMGYITDFCVDTKGSWKGLRVTVGIYKSRPDLWEKVKSGELKGFSYGGEIVDMEYKKMPNSPCSFSIEVEGGDWHHIRDMLNEMGANTKTVVRKAADYPTIIAVTTGLLALPGTIYGLYEMWKRLSGKGKSERYRIKIKTTHCQYDLEDNKADEVIRELEIESEVKDS